MTNVIVGLLDLLASMFLTCFFYIYGLANFILFFRFAISNSSLVQHLT